MKTKVITRIMLTLFLVSMLTMIFNATPVSASPGVTFYRVGDATAEWSTEQKCSGVYSVKLYVNDGTHDWAEVSIPVDIAIEEITSLSFCEYIDSYGINGWDVNVVLGVDCDGDGFEADVAGWHVVSAHNPTMLGDDSFVEMDGALGGSPSTGSWHVIDALSTSQWWTPDAAGTGFASFYSNFASFLAWLDTGSDDSRIDKGDRVKVIMLVIGGAGSWMDEIAYVDCVEINEAAILDDPIVDIDIKPGSYPNSINLGSKGVVPVAVLTTVDFDASTVDPASVHFSDADASPVRWVMEDVDYDGDMDMLFFFKTQELGLTAASTEATLTGATFGGQPIVGTDTVNIVPK